MFFYQGDGTASECNYTTQTGVVVAINGNDYSGITDKEGCWEYLIKYYEMSDKNI